MGSVLLLMLLLLLLMSESGDKNGQGASERERLVDTLSDDGHFDKLEDNEVVEGGWRTEVEVR